MGFRLACGRNALGLASELRGSPAVVFLSPMSAILASQLVSAGFRGILSRAAQLETIFPAIENVLSGGVFVDPDLLTSRPQSAFKASRVNSLSARELEVFHLLGEKKSPRDIASLLGLSVKTISNHRESIKSKLHLVSTSDIGIIANVNRQSLVPTTKNGERVGFCPGWVNAPTLRRSDRIISLCQNFIPARNSRRPL